ncbi:hypothetical protein V6N13_099341 [Hibiscus sabdariffa]
MPATLMSLLWLVLLQRPRCLGMTSRVRKKQRFLFQETSLVLNWEILSPSMPVFFKIDQSVLTGKSLPVTKNPGDEVFSGSTCKQGEIEYVVIATSVIPSSGKHHILWIAPTK